jgi:sugar (pentulose or hexulose) kinase
MSMIIGIDAGISSTKVIGIENSRVAVFIEGEEKPFIVTDTYANTLPEIDRDELKKGVKVSGEKELQKAIEDYCS